MSYKYIEVDSSMGSCTKCVFQYSAAACQERQERCGDGLRGFFVHTDEPKTSGDMIKDTKEKSKLSFRLMCSTKSSSSYCEMCGDRDCIDKEDKCDGGFKGYYIDVTESTASALDTQIGGGHYKKYEIEPVEFIIRNGIKGAEASIIKYACRHEDKNGAEDVRKIIHYGMLLLEFKYGEKWEDI